MTLGRSFLLWLLGVLVLTLILVSALVLWHEEQILEAELAARAELIAEIVGASVLGGGAPAEGSLGEARDLRAAEVRDQRGTVLWRFGPLPGEAAVVDPELMRVERRVLVAGTAAAGRPAVEVVVLVSRARVRAHLAAAAVRLLAGLGLALAIALVVGLALVGRVVGPLQELAAWARGFDPARPSEPPLAGGSPAEVGELTRTFQDLARRLAEQRQSLAASERRFRELFAASPTPLIRLDRELAIREANPAAEPYLAGGASRAAGRPLTGYLEDAGAEALAAALAGLGEGGEDTVETAWRLADGASAEVELRLADVSAGEARSWLLAIHDQTERVRRMGERWRRTFDAMVDGVALVDGDGRIALANRALEPHAAAVGSGLAAQLAGDLTQRWRVDSLGRLLECALARPEGLGHAILVVRDITEAADAEERLRAAEKLQAVGTLAAGVAHDFNNLLAAILLHARLLERQPQAAAEAAAAIRALAEEGSEVVRELLYLARREGVPPTTLDLARLVAQQEGVLRHLLPAGVALALELEPEPVPVVGDPVGLRRLLLNLVLNARDALSERGGVVAVRVEHAAGRAVLEVADDGPGIPAEVQERLFEPFFTLRRQGRGSGLGLAVVHSIVTAHGGEVDVRSREGEGTRFVVRLPLGERARLGGAAGPGDEAGAAARLLLVEPDGRAAARAIEALAGAGLELRHAPSLEAAAAIAENWRADAVALAGDAAPRGPGGSLRGLALPVISSAEPAAILAALRDLGILARD